MLIFYSQTLICVPSAVCAVIRSLSSVTHVRLMLPQTQCLVAHCYSSSHVYLSCPTVLHWEKLFSNLPFLDAKVWVICT